MVKKTCDLFKVRAKQLSQVLTSHKYLGGRKKAAGRKEWGAKRKMVPSTDMKKAKRMKDNDDNDDQPHDPN